MKPKVVRTLLIIQFALATNAGLLFAQSSASAVVMARTNTTLLQMGTEWVPTTENMAIPGGIKVFTNGTFQINDAKVRTLKEGQILRADGHLVNPDGATMPVFDHIAMKG